MTRAPNLYRSICGTMWCSQYTAMDAAGGDRGRFLALSLFDRALDRVKSNGNGRGRGGAAMRARLISSSVRWDMRGAR